MKSFKYSIIFVFIFFLYNISFGVNVRIKDVARWRSIRENQLLGYGLVVGLNGTGDSKNSVFTNQAMSNMLVKMGFDVKPDEVKVKNSATVMLTATLPPFARSGSKIDVLVSSLGDAKSLEGGILLQTPLMGADGKVYAVSQGVISIPKGNNKKLHTTVGSIPSGAIIEKELDQNFNDYKILNLVLDNGDFISANRAAQIINSEFESRLAVVKDAKTIQIDIPEYYIENQTVPSFIASIEELSFAPDNVAKVIINERTGTIISGLNVKISEANIAHGDLKITISSNDTQTNAFAQEEETASVFVLNETSTVQELSEALNKIGASAQDIVAIFQALKKAGALHAQLEIM